MASNNDPQAAVPSYQAVSTAAFASAAVAAIHCILGQQRRHRIIHHPGGPGGATELTEKILGGSEQQFKSSFSVSTSKSFEDSFPGSKPTLGFMAHDTNPWSRRS